jgi:competence protein ComEC
VEGLYAELRQALPKAAVRRRCGRGFLRREGEATITVLHPGTSDADGAVAAGNDSSLVIRISMGATAFLFMGDVGGEAERELLGAGLGLGAAVLKAGHHGSGSSSSAAFLAAVRPEVVLVSVGEGNTYGFPGAAFLDRCRRAATEVFRTDVHGAVEVRSDGTSLRVRTAAGPAGGRFTDFRLTRTTK